ncbi:chromosome partitioning protein [Clostridia bacterium]|nr:chromosome partitioning protein [Clostridia bacterium]
MQENNHRKSRTYFSSLDIYSLIKDIKKRIIIILLCGCFVSMGFYVYTTQTYKPIYKTTATFFVTNKNANPNSPPDISTTTTLATVFKTLITSKQLSEKVAESLELSTVPGEITAITVPETNLITITVYAANPVTSFKIMNNVLKTYPMFTKDVLNNAVMEILETPIVPTVPSNPIATRSAAVKGFLIGIALSFAAVVFLSYFKDSVKKETDIKIKLGISRLVSIPKEGKKRHPFDLIKGKKTALNINSSAQSFLFVESFKKLRTLVEAEERNNGHKAFLITSSVENEGKSTIAANLALTLAKKNHSVVLVDFDLRKPAICKFFDLKTKENQNLNDFLDGEARLSDIIIKKADLNLSFIINSNATGSVADLVSNDTMHYLFATLRKNFDYIIVDASPLAPVSDTEDIMDFVDTTLIVVRQDTARCAVINDTIDIIEHSKSNLMGCIFNVSGGITGGKAAYGYGYGYGYNVYADLT